MADAWRRIGVLPGDTGAGSASWPVASCRVGDAHAAVARLRSRGVVFIDEVTVPFAPDTDGVWVDDSGMQVAWLRDPDGNVLTVLPSPRRA